MAGESTKERQTIRDLLLNSHELVSAVSEEVSAMHHVTREEGEDNSLEVTAVERGSLNDIFDSLMFLNEKLEFVLVNVRRANTII